MAPRPTEDTAVMRSTCPNGETLKALLKMRVADGEARPVARQLMANCGGRKLPLSYPKVCSPSCCSRWISDRNCRGATESFPDEMPGRRRRALACADHPGLMTRQWWELSIVAQPKSREHYNRQMGLVSINDQYSGSYSIDRPPPDRVLPATALQRHLNDGFGEL